MAAAEEEHEGASAKEILIEACRRNNTDLLSETLANLPDETISSLLNDTTTVTGNHLYHEAASQGNYEIIDLLLDQPNFECDPPPAQRPFGRALIEMMLEAGSNPRLRNKGGLTPLQLIDPANADLRDLVSQHDFIAQNAGDFVHVHDHGLQSSKLSKAGAVPSHDFVHNDDDDAEFSGSDEEDRAEWERLRKGKISHG
ncbi:ankyrin repeat protein [Ophiocordyceps camponoti-floridani]|uniref:Ankyrin repeat protein n=1 Tax=Ophiocordyceps camponoti-floridani TaxID=2030778 RepID=A0A8H4QCX5_9HYPO|nr:ankyrin repeat protein [Ophiocordyceps camponoti-floridani]